MIEVLTACILITFTLMILYVIGRLFKKKPKRMDEIKLEEIQVMHLGPFSGQSNSKKGKTVTFMMLLSSLSYADVSITTLSDWNINAFDEETLLVAKTAHSNSNGVKSLIGFQVTRPHCFASRPVISARGSMSSHSDGDIIFAEMKVDKGKFEALKLKRTYGFNEDGEEVNWFKMLAFPSFAEAKSIEVKFKPQSRIKNFRIDATGIELAAYQAEQICQSPGPIQQTSYEKKI